MSSFLIGYIRPSQELLEYYRIKISEYDGDYEKLIKKLDKYRTADEHVVSEAIIYCNQVYKCHKLEGLLP